MPAQLATGVERVERVARQHQSQPGREGGADILHAYGSEAPRHCTPGLFYQGCSKPAGDVVPNRGDAVMQDEAYSEADDVSSCWCGFFSWLFLVACSCLEAGKCQYQGWHGAFRPTHRGCNVC